MFGAVMDMINFKPYGFLIYECIDGLVLFLFFAVIVWIHLFFHWDRYSCRIVWFKVGTVHVEIFAVD